MSMADRVDIADAILSGISSDATAIEQMGAILTNLEKAGYVIVRKEPPAYMNIQAKANYRMNISVGGRDR